MAANSPLIRLEGETCLSNKLILGLAVAVALIFATLCLAYRAQTLRWRSLLRRNKRQDKSKEKNDAVESTAGAAAVVEPQEVEDDVTAEELATGRRDFGMLDAPYKMILCVNMSLKMEKGKIAAQCGHATLACYRKSLRMCPSSLKWWESFGQAKIALKIEGEKEMQELQAKAQALGLVTYIVEDAGRTQIAAGSRTVLGIGPAPVKVIDSIASHLKLL
jgi:peptidyl-tRNA hydrolase, PTH2 family